MKVIINNYEYEIEKDYREAFDLEQVLNRFTDYFEDYDYVVGDWAYGKLRLKGFYDHTNKNAVELNDYNNIEEYIKKYCAYDCKYFVLKKNKKVSETDEWNNNNKEE